MNKATPTLLYIDDDATLARLVDRGLSRAGFKVIHAPGGDEGLARLAQGGIDVVALDQYMPGLDGLERPAPPTIWSRIRRAISFRCCRSPSTAR